MSDRGSSSTYLRLSRTFKVRNDNIVFVIALEFVDCDEDEYHDCSQCRNAAVNGLVNLASVVPPPCKMTRRSFECDVSDEWDYLGIQ